MNISVTPNRESFSDCVTFIGDVHGQCQALEDLLPKCQGTLIFLGDLINRGPDSAGVLRLVRSLCDEGRARVILGNHEYHLLRALGVPSRRIRQLDEERAVFWGYGGERMAASFAVMPGDEQTLRNRLGDYLEWLADFPWLIEGDVNGQEFVAVHGALLPEKTL